MQQKDNGHSIIVSMEKDEVRKWAREHAHEITIKTIFFEFSKKSGDLIDTNCVMSNGAGAAARALAEDAQKFCGLWRERKNVRPKREPKKHNRPPIRGVRFQ